MDNITFFYFKSPHAHALVPGANEDEARALLLARLQRSSDLIPADSTVEAEIGNYALIEAYDEEELQIRSDEDQGWIDFQFPIELAGKLIQFVGFDTTEVSRQDLASISAVAGGSALAWISASPLDTLYRLSEKYELMHKNPDRCAPEWLPTVVTQSEVDHSARYAGQCPLQAIELNRTARATIATALAALKAGDTALATMALEAA